MKTAGNIGEHLRMDVETFPRTTVASTSMRLGMADYDKCLFTVGMGTAAAGKSITEITVKQASCATGALTTVMSTTIGSTSATRVDNARSMRVAMGITTTDDDHISMHGITFTYSNDTALIVTSSGAGTVRYIGSTGGINASAVGGTEEALKSLEGHINNSSHGVPGITCGTLATAVSTADLVMWLDDTASTAGVAGITANATGGGLTLSYESAQALLEVHADDLTAGQTHVCIHLSTKGTDIDFAVGAVREGRHKPAIVHGTYQKST